MPTPTSGQFEHQALKYTIEKYSQGGSSSRRPVVVLLHGTDGMGAASGPEIRKMAEQIADEGFVVFVPHYFNAGDGADTLPIADLFARRVPRMGTYEPRVAAAVKYAVGQTDADGERLGMVGLSMGGGLALAYAEAAGSHRVDALVDFFGFIPDSSICANAGKLPPTLILHNEKDGIVPVEENSDLLIAALVKNGITFDKKYYQDANPDRKNHPFKPGGPADLDSRAKTIDWLKKYLKP